jgi:hypothetical protein
MELLVAELGLFPVAFHKLNILSPQVVVVVLAEMQANMAVAVAVQVVSQPAHSTFQLRP